MGRERGWPGTERSEVQETGVGIEKDSLHFSVSKAYQRRVLSSYSIPHLQSLAGLFNQIGAHFAATWFIVNVFEDNNKGIILNLCFNCFLNIAVELKHGKIRI